METDDIHTTLKMLTENVQRLTKDSNEQTAIFRDIWNEMKSLNGKINTTNERLEALRTEMHQGFQRLDERLDITNGRIDITNTRLDNIRDLAGEQVRLLRERITRIEDHLGFHRTS